MLFNFPYSLNELLCHLPALSWRDRWRNLQPTVALPGLGFLSWYVPLPQHSIGPAPLPPALSAPPAPSSCRSGAEQYSHQREGAKSCGSFVRVQRDVGFRGDLLESHSAAPNFSTSFVLPFSGYPAFVHLHLRRFFFGTKLRLQTLGGLSTFSQRLSLLSLGGHEGSKTSGCFILSIKQMAGKWRINQRRY